MSLVRVYDRSGRAGLRAAEAWSGGERHRRERRTRPVRLDERIGGVPAARNRRRLVPVPHAQYFGIAPSARTFLFAEGARFGTPRSTTGSTRHAQAPTGDSHPVSEVSHA